MSHSDADPAVPVRPWSTEQGAVVNTCRFADNIHVQDTIELAALRGAVRDAVISAALPLVHELRRLRATPVDVEAESIGQHVKRARPLMVVALVAFGMFAASGVFAGERQVEARSVHSEHPRATIAHNTPRTPAQLRKRRRGPQSFVIVPDHRTYRI